MSANEEGTSEDNCLQHECAAGAFCKAPPGTDVNASAHRCIGCRGKIHSALWCGENWGEYIKSSHCKITDELSYVSPLPTPLMDPLSLEASDNHDNQPAMGATKAGGGW
jgi:hypothetical protein